MKLATFDYTDLKGKKTQRKVLVIQDPINKLVGFDVGELDDEQIAMFAARYDTLLTAFMDEVGELRDSFDLSHNYRQFLEKSIANLEAEFV